MDNIIYIEFLNKSHLPPGEWWREPDYCEWTFRDYKCLAVRDMTLGNWVGFVGVSTDHPTFGKSLKTGTVDEGWCLTLSVHGGISFLGKLPIKFKDLNKGRWWFGFECSQGTDILPVMMVAEPNTVISPTQSYKNLIFVRSEANKLVKQLVALKKGLT
jgi:hypothetical protein